MSDHATDQEIRVLASGYAWREEQVRAYIVQAEQLAVPFQVIVSLLDAAASSGLPAPTPVALALALGLT